MVNLDFSGFFRLTKMGTPDTTKLPSSILMARPYFTCSAILQAILLLFLMFYFVISILRVIKKIKNGKFRDVLEPGQVDRIKMKTTKKALSKSEDKKQLGVIYEFDDEEEEETGKSDNKVMDINGSSRSMENEFEQYHDENETQFIKMDQQLLWFQPFLISFVICNSLFVADLITIALTVLTIASFFIFNIKQKFAQIRALQFLFIAFSLLAYFCFFYNDHDLAT